MEYRLKLKEIRKERGYTQGELAELLGTSVRKVSSWEREETKILLEDACKCAYVLGCTPNDLCGWPEGKNTGLVFNDGLEEELLEYFRESLPEQKDLIMMSARNAAGMSKSAAERAPLRGADEAAS